MKIACQSCQAKYTIADEKVLGRVVKIRCKKCGATIVINGNETGEAGVHMAEEQTIATPSSRAFDYSAPQAEEPWTVNVGDGDQRTMTTSDIVAQFKAGVVNDETYCWKDGMGDWLPLREIEALASACGLGAEAAPPPAYAAPAAAVGGAGLGGLFNSGDAGAYAASPAETNGNGASYGVSGSSPAPAPAAARRVGGRAGGADLFGAAAEAGGENDVMTSAPQGAQQAREPDSSKLTGQRNENSVLFSLNALTQTAPKEDIPGPQGDGSGLIDIRALSATMAPQTSKANHVDDIMNLGGGGAFSAALAAPVLAPPPTDAGDVYGAQAAQGGKSNKMMLVVVAIGAVVAVLLVLVLLRKPDAAATAPAGTTATATAASGSTAAPVAANDTAATPSPTTSPAASAPMGATPPAQGGPAPVDPTKSTGAVAAAPTHRSSGGSSSGSTGAAPAAAAVHETPAAPAGGGSSLDQMMKKAAGDNGSSSAPAPAAGGSAPFDRGAAAGALGGVNVASCKRPDGPTGAGHVSVTFSPDGSVSTAQVDQPPFAGTAVGGCVAGKFRGARVPAFSGGSIKVGKSFVIN